jgi:hypothetical protein
VGRVGVGGEKNLSATQNITESSREGPGGGGVKLLLQLETWLVGSLPGGKGGGGGRGLSLIATRNMAQISLLALQKSLAGVESLIANRNITQGSRLCC